MKSNKMFFLLVTGLLCIFSACGDDGGDEEPSVMGTWTQSDLKTDPDEDGVYVSVIEDCQKDNLITFGEGGIYSTDEGAVKCHEFSPQTTEGTWSITEDGTELTITFGTGFTYVFSVLTLTEDLLVIRVIDFGGLNDDPTEITLVR